jgi:hypothetical protein
VGVIVAVLGVVTLHNGLEAARYDANVPFENYKQAIAVTRGSHVGTIVTDTKRPQGFYYYLGDGSLKRGRRLVSLQTPPALARYLCTAPGPFVVLQNTLGGQTFDSTCLKARGARRVVVPERRARMAVWIVPPGGPAA